MTVSDHSSIFAPETPDCGHDNTEALVGVDYGRVAEVYADKCTDCGYLWRVEPDGTRIALGQLVPDTGTYMDRDPETGAYCGAQRDLDAADWYTRQAKANPRNDMIAALRWLAEQNRKGRGVCTLRPEFAEAIATELERKAA